jgi:hypothetical protein
MHIYILLYMYICISIYSLPPLSQYPFGITPILMLPLRTKQRHDMKIRYLTDFLYHIDRHQEVFPLASRLLPSILLNLYPLSTSPSDVKQHHRDMKI